MATVTKGRTFVSGETVTPAKLNELVDLATVTSIQTADISDSQITTAKIADANVTTAKIADANVTTGKIADANVTTAKIADAAVTQAKLASNVATTGPAFYAFATGNTSVPNNTSTKVTLAGERFDTASCFANSRFTPNVAGYYQLNGAVWLGSTGGAYLVAEIRKNGSLADGISGSQCSSTDARLSVVGGLIYLNGTTDYAELFCNHADGATRTVTAAPSATFFSGFLARAA